MNKRFLRIASFFLALHFLSLTALCQKKPDTGPVAQNREKLRALLASQNVPGASVAAVVKARTVWNEGFGQADLETNSPAHAQTKFGIGSISKSLTMVLAVRLAEDGLLDLDAPLENYLPEFPHKGRGVTIRLIGAHLSGYADEFDNQNFYNTKRYSSTNEVLKEFYKEPLAAKPGERSIYGTTTFTLVAAVIEKVTKRDFFTALDDFVLKPMQIKSIVPNDKRAIIKDRTAFYIRDDAGRTVNGEFVDPSFKLAGAGFLSTAEDLAKFGANLTDEGFLRDKSLAALFRPAETSSGEKTPFALGFRVVRTSDGREIIFQPGGGVGISSALLIDRQNKVSIAILTNQTGAPVGNWRFLVEMADSLKNL